MNDYMSDPEIDLILRALFWNSLSFATLVATRLLGTATARRARFNSYSFKSFLLGKFDSHSARTTGDPLNRPDPLNIPTFLVKCSFISLLIILLFLTFPTEFIEQIYGARPVLE
jgi:hypothetical protein